MSTMDLIKYHGGEPANFLDVGGGADKDQVLEGFRILLSSPNVQAVLVNIFGGIMKCDIIASALLAAYDEIDFRVPLVVRLEGTNADIGRTLLEKSGRKIITADGLDPHFGDVTDVEVVLVELGVVQGRRFRVDLVWSLTNVRAAQDSQSLGIGGHHAIFDAVVHHLHEVPGSRGPTVQVAQLGGPVDFVSPRGAWDFAHAWRQSLEHRVQALHRLNRTANHHAVTTLQPPDSPAGPDVDVIDLLRRELPGTADVVHVIGITAVDQDVS